jgi:hypothetical protein
VRGGCRPTGIEQHNLEPERAGSVEIARPVVDEHDLLRLRAEIGNGAAVDVGRRLAQAKIAADEPAVDPGLQPELSAQFERPTSRARMPFDTVWLQSYMKGT